MALRELKAITERPNPRSALDARTALCFHIGRQRPGASESDRSATVYAHTRIS
jgi:hypothetical protein